MGLLAPDAEVQILRASLFDATTSSSVPLDSVLLAPERWRKLQSFGQVEIYENLKQMPRAWFVKQVQVMPSNEVLRAIKQGKLDDEAAFDPAETVLLETEDFGGREIQPPPIGETASAQVKVTRYAPQRIELETHNPQPGFLVLSEKYYRGWDARIDGKNAPVYRADYTLRGIAVPPGDHRVEFVFRAPTFRKGAIYSLLGLLLLLAGAVAGRLGNGTRLGKRVNGFLESHHLIIAIVVGLLIYGSILTGPRVGFRRRIR